MIAIAMVAIAVFVSRAVKSVNRVEEKLEPLIERVTVMSEQGKQIAVQGKLIAEQFTAVSGHLSTATMHFSESLAIIKSEVGELRAAGQRHGCRSARQSRAGQPHHRSNTQAGGFDD